MLAQAQGLIIVHQHKAEHHLDAQQQGVKIPVDGGLVQLETDYTVARRISLRVIFIFSRSCESNSIYSDILLTLYPNEGMLIPEGYNSESGK